jgi:hypothetical protein
MGVVHKVTGHTDQPAASTAAAGHTAGGIGAPKT